MDIWTKPPELDIPHTIHSAGDVLKAEREAIKEQELEEWRSKVITDGTLMKFHRCATETELATKGNCFIIFH